jgi:hypothetical protein
MTVTGCLKPWQASLMQSGATPATPEAGAPTPSTGDAQYVLTDINDSSTRKSDSVAGTPSTTRPASPGSSASHAMYLLKAKDSSVNLSQHVNHKIQVTGSVSADSSSRTPDPSSAIGKPATLTVSAITMVSSTCTTTSR